MKVACPNCGREMEVGGTGSYVCAGCGTGFGLRRRAPTPPPAARFPVLAFAAEACFLLAVLCGIVGASATVVAALAGSAAVFWCGLALVVLGPLGFLLYGELAAWVLAVEQHLRTLAAPPAQPGRGKP